MASPYPGYDLWINNNPAVTNKNVEYTSPEIWTEIVLNEANKSRGFYYSVMPPQTGELSTWWTYGCISVCDGIPFLAQSLSYPPIDLLKYDVYKDNSFNLPDWKIARNLFGRLVGFTTWVDGRHTTVVFFRGITSAIEVLQSNTPDLPMPYSKMIRAPKGFLLEGLQEIIKRTPKPE